jgi:hypothetical protein
MEKKIHSLVVTLSFYISSTVHRKHNKSSLRLLIFNSVVYNASKVAINNSYNAVIFAHYQKLSAYSKFSWQYISFHLTRRFVGHQHFCRLIKCFGIFFSEFYLTFLLSGIVQLSFPKPTDCCSLFLVDHLAPRCKRDASSPSVCLLIPENEEGPYYWNTTSYRTNIT